MTALIELTHDELKALISAGVDAALRKHAQRVSEEARRVHVLEHVEYVEENTLDPDVLDHEPVGAGWTSESIDEHLLDEEAIDEALSGAGATG